MTDNVLQSFCERCGARFTQPAPAEKPPPPAGVLGRFLRRTVEPESAPDDAAALPISEAFRDTFHFCMGCRRYNCPDCWNEQEGHCLSCRPHEDSATAAAPLPDAPELARVKSPALRPKVQPAETAVVWPSGDSGRVEPAAAQAASPWGPAKPSASAESSAHQAAERPSASGTPAPGGPSVDAADEAAAATAASPTDLPWTPATELDPWRGVVFSSQDRGRVEPSVAPAWEPPVSPSGPPPAPVAAEDVGVLASLIDSEAHVDAADWARASSAVVGSGSLKASHPVEAGASDETLADEASDVAAAAALLPEEPEVAEAVEDFAEVDEVEVVAEVEEVEEVVAAPLSVEITEAEETEEIVAAPLSAEVTEAEETEEIVAAPLSAEVTEAEEVEGVEEVAEAVEEVVAAAPLSTEVAEAEEVEEVAAAAPVAPATTPSELGRADEAPLAPLPETEAWLDIARRGFDQAPDLGAGTAETAAGPDDGWLTAEVEHPEVAQQPTPAGAIAPVPPPPPSLATPAPAAPLAPPPILPVQEVSPRQGAPATPPPGLAVWATPVDPGPFAKPYQAPPPEATIFMSDAPVTPVTPVAPDARQVVPPAVVPGMPPTVPPDPGSLLPPAGQAMPGYAGAPPPTSPSPTAYVPPLPGPATGQLPPPTAPPPPAYAAGQPPASRHGAASRACPSCSLPLSTRARFCRRCGAPQPA